MPASWLPIAAPIIGGLLGGGGSSGSSTQRNEIDPRMARYVYGDNGQNGILQEAQNWYNNNRTGLNQQMLQGLNSQWNVLNNPSTMGAYQQMANLGSGLMSAPIAGNPFTSGGGTSSPIGRQGRGQRPAMYQNPSQSQSSESLMTSPQFTMPNIAPAPSPVQQQQANISPAIQSWLEQQYQTAQANAAMANRY